MSEGSYAVMIVIVSFGAVLLYAVYLEVFMAKVEVTITFDSVEDARTMQAQLVRGADIIDGSPGGNQDVSDMLNELHDQLETAIDEVEEQEGDGTDA